MANQEVLFKKGTSSDYAGILPNPYTFYYTTDDDRVYLGELQLTGSTVRRGTSNQLQTAYDSGGELVAAISQSGRIYIYTDVTKSGMYGIKIGDGNAYVIDLPFIQDTGSGGSGGQISQDLLNNINNKLSFGEHSNTYGLSNNPVQNQTLVFTLETYSSSSTT